MCHFPLPLNKYLMSKFPLLLVCWLLGSAFCSLQACRCTQDVYYLCNYLEGDEDRLVLKVKSLSHSFSDGGTKIATLLVEQRYKDAIGVPDTLRLISLSPFNSCSADVHAVFPVGDVFVLGLVLGNSTELPPPSATVWNHAIHLCSYTALNVEGGQLRGPLAPNVEEYSLSLFEQQLGDCASYEALVSDCSATDYTIYPNPLRSGTLHISPNPGGRPAESIRLFSAHGQLVRQHKFTTTVSQPLVLGHLAAGIYWLEISCGEDRQVKRLVVQ